MKELGVIYNKPAETAKHVDGGAWLVTFTDLLCLMLTFFVLTYAMQEPKQEEWRKVTHSLSQGLAGAPETRPKFPSAVFNAQTMAIRSAVNLDYLLPVLSRQFHSLPLLEDLTITRRDDHLVIILEQSSFFKEDKVTLSDDGTKRLLELATQLERIDNRIDIIVSSTAPGAEKQALFNALTLARNLKQAGYPRQIGSFITMTDEAQKGSFELVIQSGL